MSRAAPPIRPGRAITGMSAVLLPFTDDGAIDWPGFEAHLARTIDAGLAPALNMDTGFGPVLDASDRARVLGIGSEITGTMWIAGAHVPDPPGAPFDFDAYARECGEITGAGGLPILFPSFGLPTLDDDALDRRARAASRRESTGSSASSWVRCSTRPGASSRSTSFARSWRSRS